MAALVPVSDGYSIRELAESDCADCLEVSSPGVLSN